MNNNINNIDKEHLKSKDFILSKEIKIEPLWNNQDVSEFFKVSPGTVRYWCHVKAISYHKIGGLVRFRPKEVINDFECGRLGKIGKCRSYL